MYQMPVNLNLILIPPVESISKISGEVGIVTLVTCPSLARSAEDSCDALARTSESHLFVLGLPKLISNTTVMSPR